MEACLLYTSTFDVSIIEIGDGVIEVLATAGNNRLGGDDFDKKIVDYMLAEFKRTEGVDLSTDKMAMQRLKEAAEKAKKELSSATTTNINLPFITATSEGPKHFDMNLTRAKFDELTHDLVEKTAEPVQAALKDAGITAADLGKVCLLYTSWEGLGEAELTLKDTRGRRTVLYVMAALLILAADIGLCFVLPAPPNRGEITVEEFAENYNFYAEYYQNDFWNKKLNEEGEWADASTDIVYQFPASFRWPDFIFEEEDGVLTGVTVRVELEGGGELMDTFQMQEQIAALAFAGASRNAPLSVWTAVRLGNRLAVQEKMCIRDRFLF